MTFKLVDHVVLVGAVTARGAPPMVNPKEVVAKHNKARITDK